MPNREGGSAFRRGATKHQIKKSDESKVTNFVFCFCFLSSSLEKIQKEKGREETWERGNCFISSTRSLFLREETHQSHAHERTRRIINRTEHSVHFSCVRNVSIVVVVVVLLHETKERYKREPIFEKNQPLNRQPS